MIYGLFWFYKILYRDAQTANEKFWYSNLTIQRLRILLPDKSEGTFMKSWPTVCGNIYRSNTLSGYSEMSSRWKSPFWYPAPCSVKRLFIAKLFKKLSAVMASLKTLWGFWGWITSSSQVKHIQTTMKELRLFCSPFQGLCVENTPKTVGCVWELLHFVSIHYTFPDPASLQRSKSMQVRRVLK